MRLIFLIIVLATFSCNNKHYLEEHQALKTFEALPGLPAVQQQYCNTGIWKYVYTKRRLRVIDSCITITGIVIQQSREKDGDLHMLIQPDEGQEQLLARKNLRRKKGSFVVEIVCAYPTRKKYVQDDCANYINQVFFGNPGDHVRITGSRVIDKRNGWTEIHPVFHLEVIDSGIQ